MTKWKPTRIQGEPKEMYSQPPLCDIVFTYDVENPNSTD